MKNYLTPLVVAASLVFASTALCAESRAQNERVQASLLLTLGRAASAQELAESAKLGDIPIADLKGRQEAKLKSDSDLKRSTAVKAFTDAFGRAPRGAELTRSPAESSSYTALMKEHIQWLAQHPDEYAQVMDRAYQQVIRRSVYEGEIAYWKRRDVLPHTLLVGCVEDWARRNSPGLMETAGMPTVSVNCRFLVTAVLSPAVAAEARAAFALVPTDPVDLTIAAGRTLVAPGADHLVSSGHIHFVAVGATDLVARPAE
jgi:hypothetical protein